MLNITRDTVGEQVNIVISGDATVREGGELKAVLLDSLRTATAVNVVIGNVSAVDIALPQVLCAAHRMAAEQQRSLTIEGADRQPISDLLDQAGFLRHIGCHEFTRRSCLWISRPEQP